MDVRVGGAGYVQTLELKCQSGETKPQGQEKRNLQTKEARGWRTNLAEVVKLPFT